METFKEWVRDSFTPLVLVAATPAAEKICVDRNALTLVDILRPLSSVTRLEAPVRVGDEYVRMPEFRLRFHDIATLFQPPAEVIEAHLHGVLTAAANRHVGAASRTDILKAVSKGTGLPPGSLVELAPWFNEYTAEFMRVTGWADHMILDHPVAAVLAAPADVPNPVQYYEALLTHVQLPALMQHEVMVPLRDREFPRFYILLQDALNPLLDERRVADNLSVMQRTFGAASVFLLKINSGTGEPGSQGAPPEFFRRPMSTCLPGGGAGEPASRPSTTSQTPGACLTATDLDSVSACVRHLTTQLLVPRLEERIAKLNMAVTQTRKGLRNQFKRLWKGMSDDAGADKSYPWHSVESQLRQLADLAFMLGAYAFANETYRLAGLDYLSDGNHRWYAGVEEMRALAVIMSPNDNDPQKYFARAYEHYCKLQSKAGRLLATRTALMSARFQQAAGRYLAASAMLMKPHVEEENARAGVLLEQSAYCLLFTAPPSVRKFAFHMVLAALRYNSGGFKRLALHCYKQVLDVYLGKDWNSIEQHLNALSAGLSMEAGDEVAAAMHFLALLHGVNGPKQSVQNQAHQLKMFLELSLRGNAKDLQPGQRPLVPSLALPLINTRDIRVIYADTSCVGNAAASACPPHMWTPLEIACSGDMTVIRDAQSTALKQQTKEHEEYNLMAAGETVAVTVHLKNRLGVPLKASQLQLVCEFTPLDESAAPMSQPLPSATPWYQQRTHTDTDTPDRHTDGGGEGEGAGPLGAHHPLAAHGQPHRPAQTRIGSPYLHQRELSLTLHPGESVSEALSVTPLSAGWLRITGVSWVLNNTVEGYQPFTPRGRKRKHAKGPRPTQQKHFPPWRRLLLRVVPSMCSLQLEHDLLPTHMHTGEIRRIVLRIRNAGTVPCRNLHLAVSVPDIVCTHTQVVGDDPSTPCTIPPESDPCSVQPLRLPVTQQAPGLSVYRPHTPDTQLAPGASQDWVLWLHPRVSGHLNALMVWYCEPVLPQGQTTGALRFRTLRIAHTVTVSPALTARAQVGPLPSDLAAQLLRVQFDTPQGPESVTIRQLTAATQGTRGQWHIATEHARTSASGPHPPPPSSCVLHPDLTLTPGEPATLQLVMQPPPPTTQPAIQGTATHTSNTASEGQGQPPLLPCFDDSGCVPRGLLDHWYGRDLGGGASATRSRAGSDTTLATRTQRTGGASTGPGHCDPPVGLAVLWRSRGSGAVSHSGGISTSGISTSGVGGAGQERVGVVWLTDLTRSALPPNQPLRSRLRLQQASQTGVILHDFRSAAMCVVDLVLGVRNCLGKPVNVELQVGEDVSASAAQHAWSMALAGPPTAPPGSAPGTPYRGEGTQTPPTASVLSCQAGLQPSADFTWCGRMRVSLAGLEPGVCTDVPLRVAFFKPGTYAVTGCKLVVSGDRPNAPKLTMTVEPLMVRVDMA